MDRLEPIIICHPACSGGSLIYRLLVAQFSLAGVSEISHCFPNTATAFFPSDPERSLLASGLIDLAEFGEIVFKRIANCEAICREKGKRLLIREHTHSYFFDECVQQPTTGGPSWIADQFRIVSDRRIKCIVSVRDPIDCWLGLHANFPEIALTDFHQYCLRYKRFLDSLKNSDEAEDFLLVRYEDLIEFHDREFRRIAQFVNIPYSGRLVDSWTSVASSGNSGRQSQTLKKMPRRPFGIALLRAAGRSTAYEDLVKELDYPHIAESVSSAGKLRSCLLTMRRTTATFLYRATRIGFDWIQENRYKRSPKL